eukprot:CAMPEP_0180135178 /NCGR_PEP_ID=MMETSP0986-20121125/10668_1 /TAXON_ID=697907 /ORGANISM="non described non described, Strain CCMP2293" /LENGTH=518 /DNA_ID=CAMNT_0022075811 /DNA_START=102 /DNA_END=1658 /DNA_ORIENTATION=+
MTKYRGVMMVGIVIPISFVADFYSGMRDWIFRKFLMTPKEHDRRVRDVQAQVLAWNAADLRGKKLMCTARAPWLSMSVRTATFKKDCAAIKCDLKDIIWVDKEREIVKLEPLCNMRCITNHLVPLGYQLAIQIEMEDLTIGGVCMGLGMETNSHIFGLIQETIEAFEIVTAEGTIMRVTKKSDPELFNVLPWSHGTLGFLVGIELKIIKIKPYMHVTYIPCHTQGQLEAQMKKLSECAMKDRPSFLEATIYSKDTSVVMVGEFVDVTTPAQKKKVNGINYFWKEWYYLHTERALTNGQFDEYIPIRHYHHRFTRSVFWELRDLVPFGNQAWYRYLFGWLGAPKIAFIKLTMSPQIRREVVTKHVVQDAIMPMEKLKETLDKCHELFEIYPLLFFPVALFDHGKNEGFHRNPKKCLPGMDHQMFFDIGIYGVPERVREEKEWPAVKNLRKFEEFVRKFSGYTLLYADVFMTRKEFRQMLNHTLYDKMRIKYKAVGAFPEVYDKVKPEKGLLDGLLPDDE